MHNFQDLFVILQQDLSRTRLEMALPRHQQAILHHARRHSRAALTSPTWAQCSKSSRRLGAPEDGNDLDQPRLIRSLSDPELNRSGNMLSSILEEDPAEDKIQLFNNLSRHSFYAISPMFDPMVEDTNTNADANVKSPNAVGSGQAPRPQRGPLHSVDVWPKEALLGVRKSQDGEDNCDVSDDISLDLEEAVFKL